MLAPNASCWASNTGYAEMHVGGGDGSVAHRAARSLLHKDGGHGWHTDRALLPPTIGKAPPQRRVVDE